MPGPRLGAWTLAAILLAGAAGVLFSLHTHHPIQDWLVWRYLGYWGLCAVWVAACWGVGLRCFDAFRFGTFESDERYVLGFALGVIAFVMSMFLVGFAGFWSGWTFVVVPLVFLILGYAQLFDVGRRLRVCLASPLGERVSITLSLAFIGVVGLLLLYVPITHPINLGYDARWYHIAVAEQYAVRGAIEPFTEGWFNGAHPQLASMIYGWGFLLPVGALFDRIELCAHLEFVVFVATLASVPTLAKLLVGERQPHAWVFMLVFPGLYLYDSNLQGAADHIAAFFAVPVALSCFRAWHDFSVRPLALAAIIAAGPLLTKYTAVGLILGPAILLAGRSLYLLAWPQWAGQSRARTLAALSSGVVVGLAFTAPHWLKNFVYYGNPLFPFLGGVFDSDPWVKDAAVRLQHAIPSSWQADHSWQGVLQTVTAPFSFSFWVHDWKRFHGSVPVFGFLFTLTMPAILFVQNRGKTLVLYFVTFVGICYWFWTFHQDRYLQAYLPWMAACLSSVVSQAWRLGHPVRLALCILIGAQLVVGAGVPFLPTHGTAQRSPYVTAIEMFGSWLQDDKRPDLETPIPGLSRVAPRLPKDAKVLLHDSELKLGLGRRFVSDKLPGQSGIDYGRNTRPSQVDALLRAHGVSHVVWNSRSESKLESLGGDIAFNYYVQNFLRNRLNAGHWRLGKLPEAPALDRGYTGKAAILFCGRDYDSGIYDTESLTATWLAGRPDKKLLPRPETPIHRRAKLEVVEEFLSHVDAVFAEQGCVHPSVELERFGFERSHERGSATLYVKDRRISAPRGR